MKDLREFIDSVDKLGELKVIDGANWEWEMGAITYSIANRPDPPAVLFDKVEGYQPGYRVFTIPVATSKRQALALGLPPEVSGIDLVRGLREKLNEPLKLVPPVEVKQGPVMENIQTGDDVDILKFPAPQWQPRDGGRYIGTGDNVIVKDPEEGWVNVGVHRTQIHDKSTVTIFMEPGRHADIIRRKYWKKGQSCPVAATFGGDPQLVVFGGQALPWGTPEYDYAGWFKREPLEVIKGPMTGLPIPAYAEIAMEGEILPPEVETRVEGPFSEFTGYYSPARPEPAVKIKNVLHRNDPIIFGQLPYYGPGIEPSVNYFFKSARVWDFIEQIVPGVKGVWTMAEFGLGRATVISLEQKYPGHAKQAALAAHAALGYMQKYVIVVDDDVDPSNVREVLSAVSYRAEPDEFDIIKDWRNGYLDPRLPPEKRAIGNTTWSTAIIYACKPYHRIKDFPVPIKLDLEHERKVKEKWGDALK